MRSISRSLVLFFLALLTAALGAVSALSYRATTRALEDQREARRDLLRAQAEDRGRVIHESFDRELRAQARIVYAQAAVQSTGSKLLAARYASLTGGLSTALTSGALGPLPYTYGRLWYDAAGRNSRLMEVRLEESELPKSPHNDAEFFQIRSGAGPVWKSHSLGEMTLPFDTDLFARSPENDEITDDLTLSTGTKVRRVVLYRPVLRFIFTPQLPFRRPGELRGGPTASPPLPLPMPPSVQESRAIMLVVHCAADTAQRDQQIDEVFTDFDTEVAVLNQQTHNEVVALRLSFVWVHLLTLAAVGAGALALTRYGLRPLRRLSDAVSRISPRDFKLPLERANLPAELAPIAERLDTTLAELKSAFEREKRAAADISHELRTPVAAMLTTVEVALRKPRTAEQYKQTLEEVRDSGKSMSGLVERMLALAWLDAGGAKARPVPLDVQDVVRQCAIVVRPLAAAKGLTLRVKPGDPLTLTTDPDKLREILTNLLSNAVEYNRPDGLIELSARPEGAGIEFTVNDTGVGVPPELQGKIFERFFRADPSREATGLHAGLGLAIVREYVDLLGGRIALDSRPDAGSTFRVWLPNQDPA